MTAWRRRAELPSDELPWLLGVARLVLANHARSQRRRDALDRHSHTVALGSLDTTIPNPNPFEPPISVPPDPETLRRIARASGGRAFTAEDAGKLNSIYKTLGSQLGVKKKPKEITASFAIGGLILLLGAAAASQRWAGRLP